ncbi:MAG: hypothetical protein AAF127_13150 [Pseudomonadota bacterium]
MRPQIATWQLILADLALILFLVTAAALGAEEDRQRAVTPLALAPSQSLYRGGKGMPQIGEWLDSQPHDPRATLTIIAQHGESDEDAVWQQAQSYAAQARARNLRVRAIIRTGDETQIQASLGYDEAAP